MQLDKYEIESRKRLKHNISKTERQSDDIKRKIYEHLELVKEQVEEMDFTANSFDYDNDDIQVLLSEIDLIDELAELKEAKEQISVEDYRECMETKRKARNEAAGRL